MSDDRRALLRRKAGPVVASALRKLLLQQPGSATIDVEMSWARKPFATGIHSEIRSDRNGELIRRGDSLARVKDAYGIAEEPDIDRSQYLWRDRGMRIEFKDGEVQMIVYFDPFPFLVCGIWIGAYACEVFEILGPARVEPFLSTGRLWQYEVNGFVSVAFDRLDRARTVVR